MAGAAVGRIPGQASTEIIEGRLAPVLKRSVPGSGSYWLVWPQSRANYPPLEAFRAWLTAEIAAIES
ncbi:periplasmic binding fold domain-containing protein (plasmid) [Rhizobium sp. NXC24]|nr:periplasmic binding fold domain-containing protein [Rhizobium sp. NXC24]